ncbi:MAG TPA: DUF86 domain-containing protein [Spirochaetota bacterium]|nr:DUF86 domain-containing protein [Spirochaetota bacterium]
MSNRNDELYLHDILESVSAMEEYTKNITFAQFINDRKTFSATIREFEIIGEAVGKLSEAVKAKYPTPLYQDVKDFRNKLIHEYFGIDNEIVWNTIKEDIPNLRQEILGILKNEYD